MESKNILETFAETYKADLLNVGDIPVVAHHEKVILTSCEHLYDNPQRIRQTVKCSDVQWIIDYVMSYTGQGTALFRSPKSITAVIDYHAKDTPSWCSHKAVFNLAHTVEWLAWTGKVNRWMDQADFAAFLHENEDAIVEPAAGDIRSVVRQFRAVTNMHHVSDLDAAGNQATLEFKKQASASGGAQVEFPKEFTIQLRAYEGTEAFDSEVTPQIFQFTVPLKWKIDGEGAGVKFSFSILRLDLGQREAFTNLVSAVKVALGVPTFVGASID